MTMICDQRQRTKWWPLGRLAANSRFLISAVFAVEVSVANLQVRNTLWEVSTALEMAFLATLTCKAPGMSTYIVHYKFAFNISLKLGNRASRSLLTCEK